jgi:DnaJ-class molecular chaperone
MNEYKNKEMFIPYEPTNNERIYITKKGREAFEKGSLGDAIINLDQVITEDYSRREKEMYNENMQLRLRLADLEDEVMSRYPHDWFKCELCKQVQHNQQVSATNRNDSSSKACVECVSDFLE